VAVLDVPHRNVVCQQSTLEAETAANQKGHHVVFPEPRDIAYFLLQLAVAIDPVFRKVSADVCSRCCAQGLGASWVRDIEQGTGLGVALTEQEKVVG